jgi:hypothetical protein
MSCDRSRHNNLQADSLDDLAAEKAERQAMMAGLFTPPPRALPPLSRQEVEESPLMYAGPVSRSGGGMTTASHSGAHKITLSKEEADFAVKNCGLSIEEYAAQKLRFRQMQKLDPDRYTG